MTVTEPTTEVSITAGQAASTVLPADDAWSVAPLDPPGVPDGDVAVVSATVGDHTVFAAVTNDMSRRIQVGPPPADGLLDGMVPAIAAFVDTLGMGEAGPLTGSSPAAMDQANIIESVALIDGEDHMITLALAAPASAGTAPERREETIEFQPIMGTGSSGTPSGLEMLHDVEMGVTVELGRTRMHVRDLLSVVPGSVIELSRAASEPVDVMVNGTLIARGEVVVIDEEFGIRITELVGLDPQAGAPE